MERQMQRIYTFAFTLFAALCAILSFPLTASAEEPVELSGNFTDLAEAVNNDAAVTKAVEQVRGKGLYVVLVKDFGSTDASTWAITTAEKSGLRSYDGLVAIATEGREIGYAAGHSDPSSNNQQVVNEDVIVEAVDNNAVTELLGNGEWEEGVTLIASNVATIVDGGSIESKAPVYALGAGAAAVGAGAIAMARARKKKAAKAQEVRLQELSTRAGAELVQVDDAVRSAAQELEFVKVEFGIQAAQQFIQDLNTAQKRIQEAFSLRTLLGDEHPETPAQQQEMNTRILEIAQQIRETLSAQEVAFSELRNLAARAQEKVDELSIRQGEVAAQLPLAQAQLENLKLSYTESMLSSFAGYPDQINTLLESVKQNLTHARSCISSNDKNEAVGYIKLAEGTLDSATQLIQRINNAPELIRKAKTELAERIQSLTSDVHDAERLGGADQIIARAQQAAQHALSSAQNSEGKDLVALNEQLAEAETNLDRALMAVRKQEHVMHQKMERNAATAQANAKTAIEQADQYINAYRSGVNADARTWLARAQAEYAQAMQAPLERQEATYKNAMSLAHKALSQAQSSVGNNRGYGRDGGSSDFLAGMIISSVLNGIGGGGRNNGSFGGGGFGGGFSGGNFGGGFGNSSGGGFSGGRIGF